MEVMVIVVGVVIAIIVAVAVNTIYICVCVIDSWPKVGTLSTVLFADMMYELSCPFSEKAPVETDLSLCTTLPPKLIACNVLMTFFDLYH